MKVWKMWHFIRRVRITVLHKIKMFSNFVEWKDFLRWVPENCLRIWISHASFKLIAFTTKAHSFDSCLKSQLNDKASYFLLDPWLKSIHQFSKKSKCFLKKNLHLLFWGISSSTATLNYLSWWECRMKTIWRPSCLKQTQCSFCKECPDLPAHDMEGRHTSLLSTGSGGKEPYDQWAEEQPVSREQGQESSPLQWRHGEHKGAKILGGWIQEDPGPRS